MATWQFAGYNAGMTHPPTDPAIDMDALAGRFLDLWQANLLAWQADPGFNRVAGAWLPEATAPFADAEPEPGPQPRRNGNG